MRENTAIFLLQNLVSCGEILWENDHFCVKNGCSVAQEDVCVAFLEAAKVVAPNRSPHKTVEFLRHAELKVVAELGLSVKLRELLCPQEAPLHDHSSVSRHLPSLTIGSEKTQVRQIPLVTEPPWPFHFLLELGGMVVVRANNGVLRDMFRGLEQFLNNHPQFDLQVAVDKDKDGSVVLHTVYFMTKRSHRKQEKRIGKS